MSGDSPMDRRDFVMACALPLLAPLLGACASLATHAVPIEGGRLRVRLSEHPALAVPGGVLKILPSGAQVPLYVLALAGGAFAVVSPICTHRGCTVEVKGEHLVCPCHGSTYDREGRVLRGPAERALDRYEATVVQGVLEIDVRAAR
jgi:Rieske Fe-S protein